MNTPSRPSLFLSTAIPYVNAPPHLGFALEVVIADAIARHARSRDVDVHFTSGTDDHSLKNVRAAEAVGATPRAFVDEAAGHYAALEGTLDATYDTFIRTSVDPRHVRAVHALWNACAQAGDLEKRTYRGLYCAGCEQFFDRDEVIASSGICLEHGAAFEEVEEVNWFFRLSRYQSRIHEALVSGRLTIHPRERANEILRFVEAGVRDISVSRSRARARGWGIPVPGDENDQVIYVWFDALASYLTSVGFPDDGDRRVNVAAASQWRDASRRVHVLGKGIARFHAVLWPAILLAAGLPLPTDLLVHGYVTVDGRKIGKSLGNGIDPSEIVSRVGVDGLRWFLLRHVGSTNDGDISVERLSAAYSELAKGLGNLVARTLTLVRTTCGGRNFLLEPSPTPPTSPSLQASALALPAIVDAAAERFLLDDALRAISAIVTEANVHLARTEPWSLARRRDLAQTHDEDEARRFDERLVASLHPTILALAAIARALGPFLPTTAKRISDALGQPSAAAPILFPPLTK